jgi:hypothetical protein
MPIVALWPAPQPESLVAGGYALLLLLIASGIERLARRTHRRAEAYRTGGFVYLPDVDAWRCPTGEQLRPVEVDHARRLTRYRARAGACARCPLRPACTDSADGREITRARADWPESEVGRFHRTLSLVLVGLAGLVAVLALLRNPGGPEALALSPVIAAAATAARRRRGALSGGRQTD